MLNLINLVAITRRFIIIAVLAPAVAYGQTPQIPPEAMRGLADDLAQIQALINESRRAQLASQWPAMYRGLTEVTVTKSFATLKAGAAPNAPKIVDLKMGTTYKVIDSTDGWYAVQLPASSGKFNTGWLAAADVVPQLTQSTPYRGPAPAQGQGPSDTNAITDAIYRALMEKVGELRKKYENNPHFVARGFSVSLGLSPSVAIEFDFK